MEIFHIFFPFILLLQINSQINNNTDNNTVKVINNIVNQTNETINIAQRNNIIQNEQTKNQKIDDKKVEIQLNINQNNSQRVDNNININNTNQENDKKILENNIQSKTEPNTNNTESNTEQIINNTEPNKNNAEQIINNTEQIKDSNKQVNNSEQINNNIEKKNIEIKQDKINDKNQKKNNAQQNNEQNKKDTKSNKEQKQNKPGPKKEEKEKDKKINTNKAQNNNQQKNIDKAKEQKQQPKKKDPPTKQLNNTQPNKADKEKDKQSEKDKLKEGLTKSDKEKLFNLTESLINFFKATFGDKSNETNAENEEDKKRRKVEEETKKRLEADKEKRRKEERAKIEKIKMEEKKKREKESKAVNEHLEFLKILSNKSFDDIISMHLKKGEKETLYLDLDSFKKIYIAVTTSDFDLQEKFNFYFSGPNARGRTAIIYQVFNKNYIFWEYETLRKGEFIAEITNKGTKDNGLMFFFGKSEGKKKDRIDTEKIDRIWMLLNDIDNNVNQIRNKKSIEIKQANSHNEKVTKNNKWIVIYSIVEICTMFFVFLIQSCYINSLVKKV